MLHNLNVVVPKKETDRREMSRIIEKELSFNKFLNKSKNWFVNIILNDLVKNQNAECCILGCTEIELLVKQKDIKQVKLINSAQEHINAVVNIQLKRKKIYDYWPNNISRI